MQFLLSVNLEQSLMQMEQNRKHKNADCKSSQGKIFHTEKPLERERPARTPTWNLARATKKETEQQTAEQREHHSMNYEC